MTIWVVSVEENYRDGGTPLVAFSSWRDATVYIEQNMGVTDILTLNTGVGMTCKKGKYEYVWLHGIEFG